MELAKETNEPVLATPIELAAAPIEALKTAPIEAVDPKGEPIELAQVVEAPPAAAEPATVAENALPKTASSLPLVGLMGLVALVAGLGLMLISRRVLLN